MKIIFLDIDGVLNSDRSISAFKFIDHNSGNYWYDYLLSKHDPVAVALLNQITDVTGAEIFISSANRKEMSLDLMVDLFEKMGVTGNIVGYTPDIGFRGDEVMAVVNTIDPEYYVIIDDRADQFHSWQSGFLVLTHMNVGLSYGNACNAKRLLGEKESGILLI